MEEKNLVEKPDKSEENPVLMLSDQLKQQEKSMQQILWHQRFRTAIALIIGIVLLAMAFRIGNLANDIGNLTHDASLTVESIQKTLNALDLEKTLQNIDYMVEEGTDLIGESSQMFQDISADLEKSISSIVQLDIEDLNDSIKALQKVTTSIGRIFGYKGN